MSNKLEPVESNSESAALELRVDTIMSSATPQSLPLPSPSQPVKTGPTKIDVDHADPEMPQPVTVVVSKTAPLLKASSVKGSSLPPATVTNVPITETAELSPTATTPPAPKVVVNPPPINPVPQLVRYAPASTIIPAEVEIPTVATLDDLTSDAAVDDISASDSDDLLEVQDSEAADQPISAQRKRFRFGSVGWFGLGLALLVLIALGVPVTRYKLLGLVIKKPLTVTVLDSKTAQPVSNVSVWVGQAEALTDAKGQARLQAKVGPQSLKLSKRYYASHEQTTLVGLGHSVPLQLHINATGRQVPVTLFNKLTGEPIADAEIKVLQTSAKTDKRGQATIVLPANLATAKGSVVARGFNTAAVDIKITDTAVAANSFTATPAGIIYVLSDESGTLDVIKVALDGSNRQTVLKGTGKEDATNTVLLASDDWRYVLLKAQRTGTQAALYLIDTTNNDKLTEFDSGDASFTPIGWRGHSLVYDAVRNNILASQAGREVLKAYDAERGQLNQLDQSQTSGNTSSYAYQGFYNFYLLDNAVVYNTQWYSSNGADLTTHINNIRSVQLANQAKKDYLTFGASGVGYIQSARVNPTEINYAIYNYLDSKTGYYRYQNQIVEPSSGVTAATFNKVYPVYHQSANGKRALWSEQRDGKTNLFTGSYDGQVPSQISALTGYSAYGWFGDDLALISKNNSELFVVSTGHRLAPLKLTDYFKPAN